LEEIRAGGYLGYLLFFLFLEVFIIGTGIIVNNHPDGSK